MQPHGPPPRPTAAGWLCLAAAPLLICSGIYRSDPALAGLGCFLLILLPGAYLLSWRNLRGIRYQREIAPGCFAGYPTSVEIAIACDDGAAMAVEARDEALGDDLGTVTEVRAPAVRPRSAAPPCLTVGHQESRRLRLATTFRKRGAYRDFAYRLSSTYPFGLFRKTVDGKLATPVTVYPMPLKPCDELAHVPDAELGLAGNACRNGGDGEFRGIREYRHGDPLKLVHWPLSLRHQDVVVREFQPPSVCRRMLVFHDYAPRDKHYSRTDAETALELLSGLLLTLAQEGTPFDFVAPFTDWEPLEIAGAGPALTDLLSQLATVRLTAKLGARELAKRIEELPLAGTQLIVLGAADAASWRHLLPKPPGRRCLDPSAPMRRLEPLEIAV